MKNVYFVQANDVYGTKEKTTYIPYAVGCIQAYCLKNEKIKRAYHFGKFIYTKMPVEEAVALLDNPYMVLFSCSVWNTEYNKVFAEKLKERYPYCLIVFGGHNISSDGEFLRKYSYIDFLTHRFGEEPTEGILEALETQSPLNLVDNISFRDEDGKIVTTKNVIQTGADYPSPYLTGVFDEILKDDIKFSGLFESNRGCPNRCSFCDWSSLKSKVRLFPMERVKAEIDWFVEHKIQYIYCTDGNFCLFDRDGDIANYVVECKEKYGYPEFFRAFFTKNRYDFVFDVGTKFFKTGLDKAKTISFQSMNPEVLENIGRKNISPDFFRSLMKKYNEVDIATFSELILGLPGETYESFCEGVSSLIDLGQHYAINIYPCELLPNSEMGQGWYKEKFKIGSTVVPFRIIHSRKEKENGNISECTEYVTSTYSMNEEQWCKALLFASYIQGLHNLGLLRAVAIYFNKEYKLSYADFYNRIIEYSALNSNSLLNKIYLKIDKLCHGIINGENELVVICEGCDDIYRGFDEVIFLEFYKALKMFYQEVKEVFSQFQVENEILDALFKYQYDIIKKTDITDITIESSYNFYDYFKAIFLDGYIPLEKKHICLHVTDTSPVSNLKDFAREVVWYGRNRRATDYTSTAYSVELS